MGMPSRRRVGLSTTAPSPIAPEPSRAGARRARTLAVALAVAVALPAVLVAAGATASAAPRDRVVGVSLPTYHYDAAAVTAWERAVGVDVDLVQTFISWQYDGHPEWTRFPTGRAQEIVAAGATLEVTWVPSNPDRGSDDPAFSLASIARGDHDAYVRSFAEDVRDFGQPLRIRFGHEMNGAWTPYSETNSGNRRGEFVQAWRHVYEVFRQAGATNTTWVWSPNILHGSAGTPLSGLYPGDAYVDEVGIDGYSYPATGCPSPRALFAPTLRNVQALSSRPVRLAETGVSTDCPDRATWFADFFDYLDAEPAITGYTWWERADRTRDYRVASDDAFRRSARRGAPAPEVAPSADRVWGDDRYATAAALSRREHPQGADTVVLVSGEDFPDALAAAPAARALSAPVLLVRPDEAPAATLEEVRRSGASSALVVGGEAAVSRRVVEQVRALGVDVERVSGQDRFATAATLAASVVAPGGSRGVLVASGTTFADGLVGGAHGAQTGSPLLLTASDRLSPQTAAVLQVLRPSTITLVGGTAAVSEVVEEQLRDLDVGEVRRVAGADRYATAVLLQGGPGDGSPVLLANGRDFPDALAAGASGKRLLLSEATCRPAVVSQALRDWGSDPVVGVGGPSTLAVSALRGVPCP